MSSSIFDVSPVLSGLKFAVSSAACCGRRLYVGAEDGSLRVYESRDEPGASSRPNYDVAETVSKFGRGKAVRQLQVVPQWGALLSILDGTVYLHSLGGLSKPGVPIPRSAGCVSVTAAPDAGLLIITHRTSVVVLSWRGSGACASSSNEGGGDHLFSAAGSLFGQLAEHALGTWPLHGGAGQGLRGGGDARGGQTMRERSSFAVMAGAGMGAGTRERSRSNAASALERSRSMSNIGVGGLVEGGLALMDACIVSATLVGDVLLCLAVVHGAQEFAYVLQGVSIAEGGTDDDDTCPQPALRMTDLAEVLAPPDSAPTPPPSRKGGKGSGGDVRMEAEGDSSAAAIGEESPPAGSLDTGARLSYLFVHAWTGQVTHEVRAGFAPPLDAMHGLVTVIAGATSNDGGGSSSQRAGAALLHAVGVPPSALSHLPIAHTAAPGSLAASAPASARGGAPPAVLVPWGACCENFSDPWVSGGKSTHAAATPLHGSILLSAALPAARSSSESVVSIAFVVAPDGSVRRWVTAVGGGGGAEAGASPGADAFREGMAVGGRNMVTGDNVITVGEDGGEEAWEEGVTDAHTRDFSEAARGGAMSPLFVLEAHPLALFASRTFSYVLSLHAGGVHVYNSRNGALLQSIRVPSVLSLTSCPRDAHARRLVTATNQDGGAEEGTDEGGAAGEGSGLSLETLRAALVLPEVVFLVARGGIVLLRLVPVFVQVAALLSARPAQFEAALALIDQSRAYRGALGLQRSSGVNGSFGGEEGLGLEGGGNESGSSTPVPAAGAALPTALQLTLEAGALAGVSEAKARAIRSQLGFSLFAAGSFATGLAHLALALEPLSRVLALYPILLPRADAPPGDASSVGSGSQAPQQQQRHAWPSSRRRTTAPAAPNELRGAMLPPALAPLVQFLKHYRKAMRRRRSSSGALDDAAAADLALADVTLLETLLWLRNHHAARSAAQLALRTGRGGGSMLPLVAETSLGQYDGTPSREEGLNVRFAARYQRSVQRLLLSRDTALTAASAEAMLHAYSGGGGGGGLVPLPHALMARFYTGRARHAEALAALGAEAEAAVQAAAGLGYALSISSWPEVSALAMLSPVAAKVAALAEQLALLASLVLKGEHSRQGCKERHDSSTAAAGVSATTMAVPAAAPSVSRGEQRIVAPSSFLPLAPPPPSSPPILEGLLCSHLSSLLQGGAGSIGLLLGMWLLCGTSVDGSGHMRAQGALAGNLCTRVLSSLGVSGCAQTEGVDATPVTEQHQHLRQQKAHKHGLYGDTPFMWSLRGICAPLAADAAAPTLAELADAMVVGGISVGGVTPNVALSGAMVVWAISDAMLPAHDEDARAEHAEAVQNDARVLPPPTHGWGRHIAIAFAEHTLLVCVAAACNGTFPTDRASLAHAGRHLGAVPPRTATALCLLYIDTLRELSEQLGRALAPRVLCDGGGLLSEYRVRLLFLLTSHAPYDASAVLQHLTATVSSVLAAEGEGSDRRVGGGLAEERACVLGRLGRHGEALSILVHDLKDFSAAETHCADVFAAGPGGGVYTALLEAYLGGSENPSYLGGSENPSPLPPTPIADAATPPSMFAHPHGTTHPPVALQPRSRLLLRHNSAAPSTVATVLISDAASPSPVLAMERGVDSATVSHRSEAVSAVMDILARNPARIAAARAVTLLPASLPLSTLSPFLSAATRHSSDAMHTAAVARQLAAVRCATRSSELADLETRVVRIDRLTACKVCSRRLATGTTQPQRSPPFVLYPNGTMCHTGCASDLRVCPVSGV